MPTLIVSPACANALVAALDHGRPLEAVDPRLRRAFDADAHGVEVGRREGAVDLGGQARGIELEQRVDPAQRPVRTIGGERDLGRQDHDQGDR